MPYRLTEQAHRDLVELTKHGYLAFGQAQARRYLDGLYNTFELLSGMARIGRQVPEVGEGLRRFEHGRHSIFYRDRGDYVLIGRIIDNRRDMLHQFGSTGKDELSWPTSFSEPGQLSNAAASFMATPLEPSILSLPRV